MTLLAIWTLVIFLLVAARVLSAAVEDDRLEVSVGPCFIIHTACWTTAASHPAEPGRNAYIHKLRLTH